jgi:hypothetical protein
MSRSGYQQLVHGGNVYLSIGAVTQQLGRRDNGTIRRLEKAGILPKPTLRAARRRWHLEADVHTLGPLAQAVGFDVHKHRRRELAIAIAAERERRAEKVVQPIEVEVRPWRALAEGEREEEVRPWAEVTGERHKQKPPPDCCPRCDRAATATGTQRPNGERVLVSSCDLHGPFASTAWVVG